MTEAERERTCADARRGEREADTRRAVREAAAEKLKAHKAAAREVAKKGGARADDGLPRRLGWRKRPAVTAAVKQAVCDRAAQTSPAAK